MKESNEGGVRVERTVRPGEINRWPKKNGHYCETCGTECIDRCLLCGAPQCCPKCCGESVREFRRESRYAVIKLKDATAYLTPGDCEDLQRILEKLEHHRMLHGKDPLVCAVVEKDWPEYEPTWKAIEDRMAKA